MFGLTIIPKGRSVEASNSVPRSSRSVIRLDPVSVPKAPDVLADQLRERILSGDLAEGSPLPAERELVRQTQMSRATVREALRILEVQNLLRVKAGRAGGAFVQRPSTTSIANSVSMLIRGRRIRLVDLMETREAIEPFCAHLAVLMRTDQDLAELERANVAMQQAGSDLERFLRANLEWHVGVAVASHNELLIGFMTALSQALHAGTENAAFIDDDVRGVTVRAHSAITSAIRGRDGVVALRRMRSHVRAYAEALAETDDRDAIELDEEPS
ncbi:FadR/GntR family transcriptional regulator [Mycolicibacterium hodleri]|uniref:FadR family transcriptional regulator n=1 Tax=Mycolicibacterium hodleri TaxID=49897 RepID=A0A502EJL4_9MYCO|nr:FadR/GntR family transcriptional regulator [Mycolicibacterium hodleri]TPG36521.1 FadR family transcriptional regulator [Mycolicibacterium hodleri]